MTVTDGVQPPEVTSTDPLPPATPPPATGRRLSRPAIRGVLIVTAVTAVGLDILTKQLVLTYLTGRPPLRVLGGLVYLDVTRNSGAAFSVGDHLTAVFPIVALVVVTGIVLLARRLGSLPWAIALGLVLGGALGNLSDRLFRAPGAFVGHVVDFVSVFGPNAQYFPIFNVADSALSCGVVLAIVLELTGRRRDGSRVRHSSRERD